MSDKKIHVFRLKISLRSEDQEMLRQNVVNQIETGAVLLPNYCEYRGPFSADDEIRILIGGGPEK